MGGGKRGKRGHPLKGPLSMNKLPRPRKRVQFFLAKVQLPMLPRWEMGVRSLLDSYAISCLMSEDVSFTKKMHQKQMGSLLFTPVRKERGHVKFFPATGFGVPEIRQE